MKIEPALLIETAREQTGLADFGAEDFREGLELYCASVSSDAQLNTFGQAAVPGAIVGALANRLRVVDFAKQNPTIADEQIHQPWIVIGHFRAGTTFASYLLEKDERSRPLLRWESSDSIPPSQGDHRHDPRVEAIRASSAALDAVNPRIKIVQNEAPDGPTECISVLNQDFKSLTWEAMTNVPAYGQWLRSADHQSAYRYHRTVLQILQSGGVRGRWSLKSPHHSMRLDALHATYPDARLILLHRDPVVLCASVCSLIRTLTQTFSDADHTAYIARHWTQMLEDSIAGADAFRSAHPEVKIHDLQYSDLVGDPVAAMTRIYSAFGDDLHGQALAAMTAHAESRRKGRFGKHEYPLTELGLNEDELRERFASYVDRYGVERETTP